MVPAFLDSRYYCRSRMSRASAARSSDRRPGGGSSSTPSSSFRSAGESPNSLVRRSRLRFDAAGELEVVDPTDAVQEVDKSLAVVIAEGDAGESHASKVDGVASSRKWLVWTCLHWTSTGGLSNNRWRRRKQRMAFPPSHSPWPTGCRFVVAGGTATLRLPFPRPPVGCGAAVSVLPGIPPNVVTPKL